MALRFIRRTASPSTCATVTSPSPQRLQGEFYGPVLKEYTSDGLMFLLFAALGVFGTVRRLLGVRKAA